MLYYLLFSTLLGFIIHFYIIFGTNLLTQSPVPVPVFSLVSVFRRKGISNGVETEWNLLEKLFLEGKQPGRLGVHVKKATRKKRGRGARLGGGVGVPPPSWAPPVSSDVGSKSIRWFPSKNNFSSWFHSVLTPSDIPFPRNTEIGIKQQIWAGPPVNRLVPKII